MLCLCLFVVLWCCHLVVWCVVLLCSVLCLLLYGVLFVVCCAVSICLTSKAHMTWCRTSQGSATSASRSPIWSGTFGDYWTGSCQLRLNLTHVVFRIVLTTTSDCSCAHMVFVTPRSFRMAVHTCAPFLDL